MKKYLYGYIQQIENIIKVGEITEEMLEQHLTKIAFFQEERKIHLLVTMLYAILTFSSYAFSLFFWTFLPIAIILTCFLIPYVIHYFHLENGVQYLYKQYDKLLEQQKKNKSS